MLNTQGIVGDVVCGTEGFHPSPTDELLLFLQASQSLLPGDMDVFPSLLAHLQVSPFSLYCTAFVWCALPGQCINWPQGIQVSVPGHLFSH